MTTLHSRIRAAGACWMRADNYKGLTLASAFKRADFYDLLWYTRNVLQDWDLANKAYDLRIGVNYGGPRPREAMRVLRARIRLAHPSLKKVTL